MFLVGEEVKVRHGHQLEIYHCYKLMFVPDLIRVT